MAEGLHQAAASSRNRKKGERATTQEWEATMRHLLTQPQHQTALQALQLPAAEVAANVQQVLQDIVSGARQPGSSVGAAAAGSGVRWYGIKLADQGALQQQLAKLLEQQQGRSRSRSSTPAQQQQQQQSVEGGGAGGATPMEVEALEVGEFPSKVRAAQQTAVQQAAGSSSRICRQPLACQALVAAPQGSSSLTLPVRSPAC